MKNGWIKKLLPHVIAIAIFLIVSMLFCKPALDGNELAQHDAAGWKGMAQNAFEYKDKHGHFPLWNSNLFSGMPNYQIAMEGKSILPDFNMVFSVGLPKPINFFFIACVCFYILCLVLRFNIIISIAGALAYAFSTYNPVIISVGHDTKMLAIAYMPFLLAGILLIFNKKYWLGLSITTLGTVLEVGTMHPQINYYFFLIAAAISISYLVTWIKNKEWRHIGISFACAGVAAVSGLTMCALSFLTSSEYAKSTMRGGKTVSIEGEKVTSAQTKGLDTDYAFSYSMKPAEPLVMLMPNAFGSSTAKTLEPTSHVITKLIEKGVPENAATQIASNLPAYWGGMTKLGEAGTSGPPYIGVVIFLLSIIGFVVIQHPLKWGLLAVSILAILMSWGSYFPGFNHFLFDTLPLYNKFRAPSMILVIPALTLPLMAMLGLNEISVAGGREVLRKNFKPILYTFGAFFGLLALVYLSISYTSGFDTQIRESIKNMGATDDIAQAALAGLRADRSAMLGGSILRTFLFAALTLGLFWLYMKNVVKSSVLVLVILGLVNIIDLLIVDSDYLNNANYQPKDEIQAANFTKTPADEEILKDTDPNYRVFNTTAEAFSESRTSYFHKSIGGYNPAKLRIYQDLIERYFSSSPNEQVLNMLNTKYIIYQNQQNKQPVVMHNPGAYGHCWLVKNVKIVKDDVEELQAIGHTNLKDTAVVNQSFADKVRQTQWDSTSSITLTKFDNDTLEYSVDCPTPQFAVFSEVYYPLGWNAYLDGKKADYVKTNYALRGMSIPAGKHQVKFVFEPEVYKKGVMTSYIGSFVVLILVLGGLFIHWRSNKKTPVSNLK